MSLLTLGHRRWQRRLRPCRYRRERRCGGPKGWDGTPGYAIYVGSYTQRGGIVTLNTTGGLATCISADADVTITRGTLTANTTGTYSYGISVVGTLTISGGSVTANATGDSCSYGISVLNKDDWDGVKWITVPATLTFSPGILRI